MDPQVERLREIPDPAARGQRATELLAEHQAATVELGRLRREAIEELRAGGMSQTEVARIFGVTRARVGQLETTGPRPERAFLGIETLTIAVALKEEAGKSRRSPVVAQEDFDAANRLKELARELQLDADFESIAPPGIVRLNRPNLVVICGPRMSPLVAQVLESDPDLAFDLDGTGWHLVDRRTGDIYRSPMDTDGGTGDVAYLGRLPRPDGRGTFLYMAGVHAMGAAGVVYHLERHIGEIYRQVKDQRFSMLISCEFDPATRAVTSSTQLTSPSRHGD